MYHAYISHVVETFAGSAQDHNYRACLAAIKKAYPKLKFDAEIGYDGFLGVRVYRDVYGYGLDSSLMCELQAFCRGFFAALEGKDIVDS